MNYLGAITRAKKGDHFSQDESAALIDIFVDNSIAASHKMELLTALTKKGETADEIAGMARRLRELAVPLEGMEDAVDTCGTGGSGLQRFNVSTLAAFVLAACDVKVAKHGNKAASGRCGSFDLLEALGINIELDADRVKKCYEKFGLSFIYARLFHPAMAAVKDIRTALGFPTVFNLLGPLANPAHPRRHVLGVSKKEFMGHMAEAMQKLGTHRALIVRGEDGIDELTVSGATDIFDVHSNQINVYSVTPEDLDVHRTASFSEIAGGDIETNKKIFLGIMCGRDQGPHLDFTLINSAAGLLAAERVTTLRDGANMARAAIESGSVHDIFSRFKTFTQAL